MPIDDPIDEIRQLVKDGDFDGFGTALQAGSILSPAFKIFSIAKGILDSRQRGEKLDIAINALCDEIERRQEQLPQELRKALESDWFIRALTVLMIESTRAENEDRARLLARAAAYGCFPQGQDAHRQVDLASYIHDLARLGTDDIQMLKLLKEAYKDVFRNSPNLHDANQFTLHNDAFRHRADQLNIHPDDRLALGARLSGFGLACEAIPQNGEHFFRPTRRGFYLASLLEAAEAPVKNQD